MRRETTLWFRLLALWLLCIPLRTWAQQTEVVQPQFGKQTITVPATGELTFYDPSGTSNLSSTTRNNTQSATIFRPEREGMMVKLTFEEFDIQNDNKSWGDYRGEVHVFNGVLDADNSFVWATTIGEVANNQVLPAGDLIEVMDGLYADKTFYSSSADGALSVAMLWYAAKSCKGWKAKVSCVEPKTQVLTGAGSFYDHVPAQPTLKTNVALAGIYIDAEGFMQPDELRQIRFRLPQNDGMTDPLSLRLFTGSQTYPTETSQPVSATVTQSGDTYTMTLSHPIADGHNVLTLAGDISPEAEIGAQVSVELLQLVTRDQPSGLQPFSAASPVAVTNPAMVLLSSVHQNITVGDTPLHFYDDGGPDGDVTPSFEGTITFLPADASKKVQIDFTKMNLSRGTMRYQQIDVYNGTRYLYQTPIATFKYDETGLVHSTSDDGALTVVFSNGETSQTGPGFEALVSLYDAQPMTVDHIDVSHPSTETVCADDKLQPMLRVNVSTRNTFPALEVSQFNFTCAGQPDLVGKATLFFTRQSDEFTTANYYKVGETDVTADNFSITLTNPVALAEYDNIFWLALDISPAARNGQQADATLASIVVGGETLAPADGNPTGNRTVDNVVWCHQGQGTDTRTVDQQIDFRTRDYLTTAHEYEPGTDTRTTIFKPAHADQVCQIDFKEFGLQYTNLPYGGVKSTFIVYAGQGTSGQKLWELTSPDDKDLGPQKTLRSTADDGALTVVFCPNDSYYRSTGFQATVSEYKPQLMEVNGVEVTHTTTEPIPNLGQDEDLLALNIHTVGDLSTALLQGVSIDLKGLQAHVSRVRLYGARSASVPLAEVSVSPQESTCELPVSNYALAEGDNRFTVTVDVASGLRGDETIDAAVAAITVDGKLISVNGDPEGQRTVKNIYNLPQGADHVVVVPSDVTIQFYDDGGAAAAASFGFNGTVTFKPETPGEAIRLDFRDLSFTYKDVMTIYNGAQVSDDNLALRIEGGQAQVPDYLISQAADGSLTVNFAVGSTLAMPDGFYIDVSTYAQRPLRVTAVEASPVAPTSVVRGQDNIEMLRLTVSVDGLYAPLTISRFDVEAAASPALSHMAVYAGSTADAPIAQAEAGPSDAALTYNLQSAFTIAAPGTYTFLITADTDNDAPQGSQISLAFKSLTVTQEGAEPLSFASTAEATTTLTAGFRGTLTVGAGGNYGTIQAAVDAVSGGIDGPVTINILPGIYNERVNVPDIPGTSSSNTLTIQSATGSYRDVKIYHDRYDDPGYSDDHPFLEYGVFTVAGSDYVTLQGVEVTTTDLTYPSIVHVKNVSRHFTLRDSYIHADKANNVQEGINLVYSYAKSEPNQNNDYMTVENNRVEGGWIGIYIMGTNYVSLPKQVGGRVLANQLSGQGSKAIYVSDELGAQIRDNRIENHVSYHNFFAGIDTQMRDDYHQSMAITGNTIVLRAPGEHYGLYLRELHGTAEAPVIIANNEIVFEAADEYSSPVFFRATSQHVLFAHNTVRAKGRATNCLWFNVTEGPGMRIVNNLLQNEGTGTVFKVFRPQVLDVATFDSNHLWAEAGAITFSGTAPAEAPSFALNEKVTFLADEILEPAELGTLQRATLLPEVATDLCGRQRPSQPTIGAYEWTDPLLVPEAQESTPAARNINASTADIAVCPTLNATAFILVREQNDPAPTADELLQSTQTLTLHAGETGLSQTDPLVNGETYVAYVLLRSLRGVCSTVLSSKPFTISGETIVETPAAAVKAQGATVEQGSPATLTATALSGTAPFIVSWHNGLRQVVGEVLIDDVGQTATVSVNPTECDDYVVSLTDALGKTAQDTCRVVVTGEALTATFENLYLDDESHWIGPDTKGHLSQDEWGSPVRDGSFVSGTYAFHNSYNLEYAGVWSGFAYANHTATNYVRTDYMNTQFNNVSGTGHNSDNYIVGYAEATVTPLNSTDGTIVPGFWLNNTAWAKTAFTIGDGITTGAFTTGDYLKLVVTATHPDGSTTQTEVFLADYRDADAAQHYYLQDWTYIPLQQLGVVTELRFTPVGSRYSEFGAATPLYFCMDDFGAPATADQLSTLTQEPLSNRPVQRFAPDGRLLSKPQRGINIERMADGTVRKTLRR